MACDTEMAHFAPPSVLLVLLPPPLCCWLLLTPNSLMFDSLIYFMQNIDLGGKHRCL
jgi:hypothetical protein